MAKAKAKKLSPAERYAQLRAKQMEGFASAAPAKDEELFDFVSPSGMEWKLRRPNIPAFVQAGALPVSLAQKMVAAMAKTAGKAVADTMAQLSPEEQARAIEFTSLIVRYCAVEPRIVEVPQSDDEIAFDDVMMQDYNAIANWAVEGGEEAATLANFRSGK